MKLSELKEILDHLPEDLGDPEVVMADFSPVTIIDHEQHKGNWFIIVSDYDECEEVDIDELMHEQQERDAEFAEQYAEMMSDIF